MIKVNYDHSKKMIEGRLPIKSISVGSEIQSKEHNFWEISTHYREQGDPSIRQIGIRVINPTSSNHLAIASRNLKSLESLSYNAEYDIWYQQTNFVSTRNKFGRYHFDEKTFITGVASTGSISILETVTYKELGEIEFFPSSLSIEDYDVMLAELYQISEDFVREDKNLATAKITSNKQVSTFEKEIEKLTIALHQINHNPYRELRPKKVVKKSNNHSRFHISLETQKYIKPGKNSHQITELYPESNIIENQMILQILNQLQNYFKLRINHPFFNKHLINRLENERTELLKQMQLSRDESNFLNTNEWLQSKITELKTVISLIENIEKEQRVLCLQKSQDVKKSGELISIEFLWNGTFLPIHKFKHCIDDHNVKFQIEYNHRSTEARSIFKFVSYNLNNTFDKVPNSFFGKINMTTLHLPSHLKLHHLFSELNYFSEEPRQIKIIGRVNPIPVPRIDAVSSQSIKYEKYHNYFFDFTYISEILVNGHSIELDDSDQVIKDFITKTLPYEHTSENLSEYEQSLMLLSQFDKIMELNEQINELQHSSIHYGVLNDKVTKLLQLPIFNQVSSQHKIPIKPTNVFLHNPSYRLAWQAIHALQYEPYLSLGDMQTEIEFGTNKSYQLYEVWALFKMVHLLTTEMGWRLNASLNVHDALNSFLIKNGSLINFHVTLYNDSWTLNLYYEPKIRQDNSHLNKKNNYLTPDFVFKFSYNETVLGISILDTKYRNYTIQGINEWKKDLTITAINKYGNMHPLDPEWQVKILSSSIMHSTEGSSFFEKELCHPYHVLYNSQLFDVPFDKNNAHRYSSITMTPSNTLHFKNWFRMQLEYHLNFYSSCWNCGELEKIQVKQLSTKSGFAKFHYTCQTCHEFWVKVHCSKHGHTLIKHSMNYHLQEKLNMSSPWYVKCPKCENNVV